MISMKLYRERGGGEVWAQTQRAMTSDHETLLQQDRGEQRVWSGLEIIEKLEHIKPHGQYHSPCRHRGVVLR